MLLDIYCDKFLQKHIIFHNGLNVILGGSKANNSIGKSTLLLIVDYCFGGDTYCSKKNNDIRNNIGDHIIYFTFKFGDNLYRFGRDTRRPNVVMRCDDNNVVIDEMEIDSFNTFLNSMYFPENSFSFRTTVSRFMRIAGKENIHDDKPLKGFNEENDNNGINVLEDLLGFYKQLKDLKEKLKLLKEENKTRKNAKKFNIISNRINNKKDYKQALNERQALIEEKDRFLKEANIRHFDGDTMFSKEAIELKVQLENLLKNQSRLNYRRKKLEKSLAKDDAISEAELNELATFFPDANIKRLSEINCFHKGIISIVTNEIKTELELINSELKKLTSQIEPVEKELNMLNIPNYISPDVLKTAFQKETEIINSTFSIEQYEKEMAVKNSIKETKLNLAAQESFAIDNINETINAEMEKISDEINITKRYSPKLAIKSNDKYLFETPNDTGTGSKYKNIIVFDLSVLKLSPLPVLVHDSIMFKNIGDDPIRNIFKQYMIENKQVFISIDKIEDYHSLEIESMLKSKAVIELDDGKELFGRSWGNIE